MYFAIFLAIVYTNSTLLFI